MMLRYELTSERNLYHETISQAVKRLFLVLSETLYGRNKHMRSECKSRNNKTYVFPIHTYVIETRSVTERAVRSGEMSEHAVSELNAEQKYQRGMQSQDVVHWGFTRIMV